MDELIELNEGSRVARRELLRVGGVAGLGVLGGALLAGCGGSGSGSSSNQNQAILNAALTAEMLATTMYYNIITTNGGIYSQLSTNLPDQAYLVSGYEQELNHAEFLAGAGAKPLANTFYFPTNMFVDPQTTVNTLITLEDAFIAAYLIGIRDFSTSALKVIAGQILGVEAEHRVLARVIANDLNLSSTTGLSGSAETVTPPNHAANNIAYERTFSSALPNISAVVSALGPFVASGSAGYSTTPFTYSAALQAAPSAGQPTVALDSTTTASFRAK